MLHALVYTLTILPGERGIPAQLYTVGSTGRLTYTNTYVLVKRHDSSRVELYTRSNVRAHTYNNNTNNTCIVSRTAGHMANWH